MSDKYFAARDAKELVQEIEKRRRSWFRYAQKSGLQARWEKSFNQYFGCNLDGDKFQSVEVTDLGKNGELKGINVNHYRNLIRHVLSLVAQPPAFDPKAVNTDLDSIIQTKRCKNLIEYFQDDLGLEKHFYQVIEMGLVCNKAFIIGGWNTTKGKPYGTTIVKDPSGQPIIDALTGQAKEKVVYEGEPELTTKGVMDVRYDRRVREWKKVKWTDVTDQECKYDLAAQYPHLAEDIIAVEEQDDEFGDERTKPISVADEDDENTDIINTYSFYHLPTPALPNGRYLKFINEDLVLYDGPYQYGEENCVKRFVPGEILHSTEGYSDAMDLLVLQQVYNVLTSTEFTNQQAFGTQVIWAPANSNLTSSQLSQGLTLLKGGDAEGRPIPLQLCATPPEISNNKKVIKNDMETVIGVNAAARGDPDHNLKSGIALGRVQAMAIQYASNLVGEVSTLQKETVSFLVYLFQTYAKNKRMIAIGGKSNQGFTESLQGEDLNLIKRVGISLGNPLSRTPAGRIEMADAMLQKGMLKTPKEYFTVLSTGNLDALTEGEEAELSLIRQENEGLMEGKDMMAMTGDAHLLHAQEHKALLSNPAVRMSSPIVQKVLSHIQQHIDLYKTQDPVWSAISGEPPAPMPPMPVMPPGPGGPPMDGPPPPMGGPGAPQPPMGLDPNAPPGMEPPPLPPMPQGPM